MSLTKQVATWSDRIQDDRDFSKVLLHMNSEVVELWDEYFGIGDGNDGMFGEAIDVILCALDLIRLLNPEISIEELEEKVRAYAEKKCEKWEANVAAGIVKVTIP